MEPDRLRGLLEPETRTIIRFYFWAAGPGKRKRTIIRSGQQVEPGWAGTRKANNGGFLRVWWLARQPEEPGKTPNPTSGQTRARLFEAPPQVFLLFLGFYVIMLYRLWVVMGLCG